MPFRHVVMFKWAEGLDDDHVDRVRDGLSALPPQIEQIRSYVHGTDVGVSEGNFDYVLVADFDNVNDFRTTASAVHRRGHQGQRRRPRRGAVPDRPALTG